MGQHDELGDFKALVSWACWQVIEGITKGEPLNKVMFGVLDYARRWEPPAINKEPTHEQ